MTQPRWLSQALYRDNRAFLRGPSEIHHVTHMTRMTNMRRLPRMHVVMSSRCSLFVRELPLYFWGAFGPRWTIDRSMEFETGRGGRICVVCRACMSRCSSFIREVPLYFWGGLGPRWTDGRSIDRSGQATAVTSPFFSHAFRLFVTVHM